jgi:putative ABC transport system permease protein
MSVWREISRGMRVLENRKGADQDVADEVDHYLEEATNDLIAKGLSPEDANRAVRRELGSSTAIREQVRGYGWENMIDAFFADLRHALRRLRQKPGFAAASLLTLALGIGATTSIFSVVDGILLKPLPYSESGQLVSVAHTAPGLNLKEIGIAASLYVTYGDESRVFQNIAMWATDTATVTNWGPPEELPALLVTSRFLSVLRVQLQVGRNFTDWDGDPRSQRTVIFSDAYWRSRFGGDRSVIGRRMMVDDTVREVIGVLPPSFEFMDRAVSLVIPARFNRNEVDLMNYSYQGIARLKPGVTLAQANADVARMLPIATARFPLSAERGANVFAQARIAPALRPLKDVLIGDVGNTLWVLMGTVGIVLLIACANVANLLLVRAEGRRQELAIRAALGAGRGRIMRELLLESVILSVAGGMLGLLLTIGVLRILASSELPHLPRIHDVSLDPAVLAFALAISLATGLLFGLIPALKYARPQLSNGLWNGGRSLSHGKEQGRTRGLLVIVQVALALVLLVGSGLMMRTFLALRNVDPGFSGANQIETMRISIPSAQVHYHEEQVMRMEEEILRKIEAIHGVSAVGIANTMPLESGSSNSVSVYVEGQASSEGSAPPIRRYKSITPGYLTAMGSRLILGRDLTWSDTYNQSPVVLVSENMARELWRDPRAALGKRIRFTMNDQWRQVIGVVADLRDDGVDRKAPTIAYCPYWPMLQNHFGNAEAFVSGGPPRVAHRTVAFMIRTPRAGRMELVQELQRAVASVNSTLPVSDVKTLEAVYDRSLARITLTLVLLAIAGGMSLLLGVIGIYGVISYSVSQRTREIGIRLALGAPVQDLTRMFVRDGIVLSGIGAACGLTAAVALTRFMKTMLYDVSPMDPLTYGVVSAGLMLVAALASYLPARRAAGIDPAQTLRTE